MILSCIYSLERCLLSTCFMQHIILDIPDSSSQLPEKFLLSYLRPFVNANHFPSSNHLLCTSDKHLALLSDTVL